MIDMRVQPAVDCLCRLTLRNTKYGARVFRIYAGTLCTLWAMTSVLRKALSLRKPIPRSEGSRDYHRCAHKKVSSRETKVRRDLHVGSGISRHLHRLFASSPVINSPGVVVTLSPSYIRPIYAVSFQFTQLWSKFTYWDLSSSWK